SPESYSSLDEAIANLFGYDWLVLKNEAAAISFLHRFQNDHEAGELDDLKTLAIGDSTSEALGRFSIHVDLALDRFSLHDMFAAVESYARGRDSGSGLNTLWSPARLSPDAALQQTHNT